MAYFILQLVQLVVLDWLLETRTALWEQENADHPSGPSPCTDLSPEPVAPSVLAGFQRDVCSLRRLAQQLPVSIMLLATLNRSCNLTTILVFSVHSFSFLIFFFFSLCQAAVPRVFVSEATARLMAGAAPGRTQQLLDRSLRHRNHRTTPLCGKGNLLAFFTPYYSWPCPYPLLGVSMLESRISKILQNSDLTKGRQGKVKMI